MSKIFEALQFAQAEQVGKIKGIIPQISELPPTPELFEVSEVHSVGLESEMLLLGQNIGALLPDPGKNVVQFLGASEKVGTSTLAREFSKVLANHSRKSVLLVESDLKQYEQHQALGVEPKIGLEQLLHSDATLEQVTTRVGKSNLFLTSVVSKVNLISSSRTEDLWKSVREKFELIVIDSPAVHTDVGGLTLCSSVDGVVLVLDADKTQASIARSAKEQILQNGGNLLGIVFNKRRFYIPDFIDKFL